VILMQEVVSTKVGKKDIWRDRTTAAATTTTTVCIDGQTSRQENITTYCTFLQSCLALVSCSRRLYISLDLRHGVDKGL